MPLYRDPDHRNQSIIVILGTVVGVTLTIITAVAIGVSYLDRISSDLGSRLSRLEARDMSAEYTALTTQQEECKTSIAAIGATQLIYGHRLDELEKRVFHNQH